MKIHVIGGGPGGLYFAILAKRADPERRVVVHERNRVDDPFGFGVVFSDATGHNLAEADPPTFARMSEHFAHWDDIDIHYRGEVLRSTGHGFSGLSRLWLLRILSERAEELGVEVRFGEEVGEPESLDADLIVAADGFNSGVRERYPDVFRPAVDVRPNRFVWFGTTRPFPAFTFYFKRDEHGLWRVHAYQYEKDHATFIVETTEATWLAAGLEGADEDCTRRFCEALFAEELDGHSLLQNRSIWRQFGVVTNERWWHAPEDGPPIVLLGDSAHTAHFSIGSGTKLAMEDAIALRDALGARPDAPGPRRDAPGPRRDSVDARAETPGVRRDGVEPRRSGVEPRWDAPGPARDDLAAALAAYQEERRPPVESLQRAARVSMDWFEQTERFMESEPLEFAFNLLTRSLRVTHDNLKLRDPAFVDRIDRWFAAGAEQQSGEQVPLEPLPPPAFTPFRVRELVLRNRVVVSPMCQYSAEDGMPNDWHLVHLGSRAIGGAGLVMAEMTDVSAEGRITHGCAGLYRPEHVSGWRRIVDFVHGNSYAKIGIQLGHAGRKASTCLPWEGGDNEPLASGGWSPIMSASPLPYFPHSPVPREMNRADMERVIADHVRAAELAEAAGFDWLELHCAHGYLLASFVSPATNRRTDEYGGSLENRLRFPLEVFDAVRAAWPAHKPMSVRISAVDWVPDGMDSAEAVNVARAFKEHGADLLDVSAGQTVAEQEPVYGRLFQTPFSDRIRHEAEIPTMAVGNISSYTDVNTILAAGRADLCLLARAHLWDPYWTRHAAYEMGYPLEWPPQYASLNRYTPRFE